jgi:hypothetical protein
MSEITMLEKLRDEAEELLQNMTQQEWEAWKKDYAEVGGYISDNAHTTEEKQEMFIHEYIEMNLWD